MSNYPTSQEIEEFEQNLAANMRFIKEHLDDVDSKAFNFAKSLCDYYETYDKLSTKQLLYAAKFFKELKDETEDEPNYSMGRPTGDVATRNSNFRNDQSNSDDIPRVVVRGLDLLLKFQKAAEDIKYPKLYYWFDDGSELCIYRTGMSNKHPGSAAVIHKTGATQKYYGKVLWDTKSQNHGYMMWATDIWGKPEMQQLIKKIVEDTAVTLAINGKKFGICCFCARHLENQASLAVGYGPICAEKYGLPWGEEKKDLTPDVGLEDSNETPRNSSS